MVLFGSVLALVAWVAVLVLPWQAHRTRERLEGDPAALDDDLSDVTVLIPAAAMRRAVIERTIDALKRQGRNLPVIVIDDQSSDGTADACAHAGGCAWTRTQSSCACSPVRRCRRAGPASCGRCSKASVQSIDRSCYCLDADIELASGTVPVLRREALARNLSLVSVMAKLNSETFWERLLAPSFVFFFKLLYPFALANDPSRRTAAAAGGCMFLPRPR